MTPTPTSLADARARAVPAAPAEPAADRPPFKVRLVKALQNADDVINDSQGDDFDFASMRSVLKAIRAPLFEQGILLTSRPQQDKTVVTEIPGPVERPARRVEVTVDFEFSDAYSDETHVIHGWRAEAEDLGIHAQSKAMTSAVKTFIKAQWLLPIGDAESTAGRTPTYRVPGWAISATDEAKARALATMTGVFGHEATAKEWLDKLAKGTGGTLTQPVALAVGYLDEWIVAANAASKHQSALARADADLAQAAAEEGDLPAGDPEPDFDPGSDAPEPDPADEWPADDVDAEPPADEPEQVPDLVPDVDPDPEVGEAPAEPVEPPPGAGTVKPPVLTRNRVSSLDRLQQAGCTCPNPPLYGQKATDRGIEIDNGCLIKGHGRAS